MMKPFECSAGRGPLVGAWVTLMTALLIACDSLHSQAVPTVTVPEAPSCKTCKIEFRTVATIGAFDGPGTIATAPTLIQVDSRGRYFVFVEGGLPQVFGPTGEFIATFGGRGQGPGEFMDSALPVVVAGDTVVAFDPAYRRAAVFTPDLRFVRQISLPGRVGAINVLNWPNEVAFIGVMQTRDRYGWTLHILDLSGEGEVVRSGGPNRGEVRPGQPPEGMWIGPSTKGKFWTAEFRTYLLSEWDERLNMVRSLRRTPDWWPKLSDRRGLSPGRVPEPMIKTLAVDSEGLLWVYTRIASSEWAEAWPNKGGEISFHDVQHEKLYDTFIEVFDPVAAKVIARASIEPYVLVALPDRRAAAYVPTADGVPQIQILQLTISGR